VTIAATTATALDQASFARLAGIAHRDAGILLGPAKRSLVQNRLTRRLAATGLDFPAYAALVEQQGSPERAAFLEAMTTHETFFFRHHEHWDLVIAELARIPRPPRIWSAAASSGEEAYSAAIACGERHAAGRAEILATDLSRQILAAAERGEYGAYALQKVTDSCRARWFVRSGPERWRITDRARQMVAFRPHNLLEPLTAPDFDIILLRNVLIYFDAPTKERAVRLVAARLRRGGLILLGGSETLPAGIDGLVPVRPQVYRRA
jgi:chemotaxis protein methyltransferase CheR